MMVINAAIMMKATDVVREPLINVEKLIWHAYFLTGSLFSQYLCLLYVVAELYL